MTTTTILKAINALPAKERLNIIEQIIHTMRLEEPEKPEKKVKRKKNPDNPSPSGDPWFDDPRNIAIVEEAIRDLKEGKGKCVTVEESPSLSAIFAKYR
jgi:hypothetical protein